MARKIHDLRSKAAPTQIQLAKLIGTAAAEICRLEDADYEGHSLAMLRRIAGALNRRVEIRFVPLRRQAQHDRPSNRAKRPRLAFTPINLDQRR